MIDAEAQKIGIGAPSNETAAEFCAPPRSKIVDQRARRMLRTANQWLSRHEQWVERKWLFEDMRGGVGVSESSPDVRHRTALQFNFRAVRYRFVDIDVLALTETGLVEAEIDLVA